jgi:hypothetical protein
MARKRKSISPCPVVPQSAEYGTKEYDNEFYGKFLYYNEKTTDQSCKETVITYLKTNNKSCSNLETIHSKNFKPVGLYLIIQQDGIRLPETEKNLLESGIQNFIRLDGKRGLELEQIRKTKSVQERYFVQKTTSEILNAMDNQVAVIQKNQRPQLDFKTFTGALSSGIIKLIETEMKDILERNIKEIKLAKNKKDLQLVEAYSYLNNKQLKCLLEFYQDLLLRLQSGLVVKTKIIRKTKPKTPDKLVKKLKYKLEEPDLGLRSQNPIDIIGSCIIFVYNTKTRFIYRYQSDCASVKGSTLINIDQNNSKKKKIRNPKTAFNAINPTNVKFMERLWDNIKTKELQAKTRINQDCIILSCINKIS